jgi:L-amino acid N-acyltransferase YncA
MPGPPEASPIRLATPADAPDVARIYAGPVQETAISFELVPPTPDEMAARIEASLKVAPWLVFAPAGRATGYAYATRHRERAAYQWSVDVSVYIDPDHRRRGVGRALYESLLALLKLQGFYAAHAGITLPNPGSVGLHESLGFEPVGVYRAVGFKQGAWHDVGWWQLVLRERAGTPQAPRPLAEALTDPGFAPALQTGIRALGR